MNKLTEQQDKIEDIGYIGYGHNSKIRPSFFNDMKYGKYTRNSFLNGHCLKLAGYLSEKYNFETHAWKRELDNGDIDLAHAYSSFSVNNKTYYMDIRGITDNEDRIKSEFNLSLCEKHIYKDHTELIAHYGQEYVEEISDPIVICALDQILEQDNNAWRYEELISNRNIEKVQEITLKEMVQDIIERHNVISKAGIRTTKQLER